MAKQPAKGKKKPTRSRKPAAKPVESTVSPVLIDAIPPEVHHVAVPKADKAPEIPLVEKAAKVAARPPEPKKEPAAKPVPPRPVPAQKSGFFPLLLGGLIAGAIGYGAAIFMGPQQDTELANSIAEQSQSIDSLRAKVAEIPVFDATAIIAKQETLADDLGRIQTDLTDGLTALDVRIAQLETLPVGDGTVSDRVVGAVEADLEALRAEMAELTDAARTQLDDARAEAASIEENAASAARAAAGRAALARIRIALDNGEPLGAALGDLEAAIGGSAPDALIAAQDGVPTLASLQDGFKDVAGPALAAARSAGVAGEETSGIGAFLKNQFDVRSVTPQEGDNTDAILSRVEAAVKIGRLSDALAEVSALPEVARAAMSDWLGQAEMRAAATAAVDVLTTSLNDS